MHRAEASGIIRSPRPRKRALLEREVRAVEGAVRELQDELATGAGPRLVGLPDVVVLAGARLVAQRAATGGHRREVRDGIGCVTRDRAGPRVPRGEDVQTLVSAK